MLMEQGVNGYFVASLDGKVFTPVAAESVEFLLSRMYSVYFVDESVNFSQPTEVHVSESHTDPDSISIVVAPSTLSDNISLLQAKPQDFTLSTPSSYTPVFPSRPNDYTQAIQLDPSSLSTDAVQITTITSSVADTNLTPQTSSGGKVLKKKVLSCRTCLLCNIQLDTSKAYRSHMAKHECDRPYRCSHCDATFNYQNNLTVHIALENPGTSPFQCPLCESVYRRLTAFKSHVKIHQSYDEVSCPVCRASFPSPSLLRLHSQLEHKPNSIETISWSRCRVCQANLPSVGEMLKHYRLCHPDQMKNKNSSRCVPSSSNNETSKFGQSDDTLVSRRSKKEAIKFLTTITSTKRRPVDSKLDSSIEFSGTSNETNASMHRGGRPKKSDGRKSRSLNLRCMTCKRKFGSPALVRRHMVQHNREKPYKCAICNKHFTQKSSAKAHLSTHSGTKSGHVCRFCAKTFRNEDSLLLHLRRTHHPICTGFIVPSDETSVLYHYETTDGIVESSFVTHPMSLLPPHSSNIQPAVNRLSRSPLNNEADVVSAGPVNCSNCGQSICEPDEIQNIVSSPICSVCQSTVSHQSRQQLTVRPQPASRIHLPGPLKWNPLKNHFNSVQRKLSNRRYKCAQCPHSYERMSHLRYHLRQSHDHSQAPFACHKCSRRFVSARGLERHLRLVHVSEDTPQQATCPICAKILSSRGSLKRHMGIHSDVVPYKCPICHCQFKFYSPCAKHIARHGRFRVPSSSSSLQSHPKPDSAVLCSLRVPSEHHGSLQLLDPSISTTREVVDSSATPFFQTTLVQEATNFVDLNSINYSAQYMRHLPDLLSDSQASQYAHPMDTSHPTSLGPVHTTSTDVPLTEYSVRPMGAMPIFESNFSKLHPTKIKDPAVQLRDTDSNVDTIDSFFGCGLCRAHYHTLEQLRSHVHSDHLVRPKPYRCDTCGFSFASEVLLLAHRNTHSNNSELLTKCPACPLAKFNNRSALTRHILACHPLPTPDPFYCTHCGKSFRFLRSLNTHVSDLLDTLKQQNTSLESKVHGQQELSSINEQNRVPEKLNYSEKGNKTLSERYLSDVQKLLSFKSNVIQRNYVKTRKVYCCSKCKTPWSSLLELRRHLSVCSESYRFSCPHCERGFSRNVLLQNHISRAHRQFVGNQSDSFPSHIRFTCHLCGSKYSSKTSLRNHMYRHAQRSQLASVSIESGTKENINLACPVVMSGDANIPKMATPTLTKSPTPISLYDSSTQRPVATSFRLELADMPPVTTVPLYSLCNDLDGTVDPSFTPDTSAVPFIRDCVTITSIIDTDQSAPAIELVQSNNHPQPSFVLASGIPDYAPSDCSTPPDTPNRSRRKRRFRRKKAGGQNSFKRIHQCTVCSKTFTKTYSLRRHEYIHQNHRPHVCNLCGATFVQSSSLNTHLLIHSNQRPHQCSQCTRSFRQKSHLLRHMRSIHAIQYV